ncbi:MAG: HNH endonuclease [Proteobacteria bacterium]|nr:HNH endonuclease [Desulfobacteraceae bacterium]MBU4068446.1 HNH endonuclease [Pseudomonadota bacterium]MBU4100294.1 HNH endonuclease [Pseudomonadota bacterium]
MNGKVNYKFVSDRFKALCGNKITISGTIREWQKEQELPKECVFCYTTENLQMDHLIPRNRGGNDSADNMVWSCQKCNSSRGDKGVFVWLGLKEKDNLHRLVAGKYLKRLFDLHTEKETMFISKDNIETLCKECKNKPACIEWDKVKELTCFCLESIF